MDFPPPFPLDPNLGALQIGFLVSGFLFGALTVQALIYNRKFAKDHWTLKSLVTIIWAFELGQLGCTAHALYTITVTQSGNLLAVLSPPRTIGASFLLGSTVGPLIEAFYVSRLLRFSGHLWVALIGWFLALARCGGWMFLATRVIVMTSLSQWENDYGWLFSMLLGISAVVDLAISAWIAYFLGRRRARARESIHNQSIKQLLDRVILWTLQTGVITSLSFLVTLVSYLILGQYLIWLAVLAILTKVSSNCFLASLNARSSTNFRGRSRSKSGQSGRQTHGTGMASSHARGVSNSLQHHTAHSLVNNIIELYQLPPGDDIDETEADRTFRDDASSHFHFEEIHRSRGHRIPYPQTTSFGHENEIRDRSAFSPDGTIVSAVSSHHSEYWAL